MLGGPPAPGFERPGARALIAVGLDFWTWRRFDGEGRDDAAAVAPIAGALHGTGS